MSRHFIWFAPLSNLLLFTGIGLLLAVGTKLWPRRGGMLCSRLVCMLAIASVLLVMNPRIYPSALAILATGVSFRLVPFLDAPAGRASPCADAEFSNPLGNRRDHRGIRVRCDGSKSGASSSVPCRQATRRMCS